MSRMRVVQVTGPSGPLELTERPTPESRRSTVRVKKCSLEH